jgi:hypothetical protein
MNSLNILEYKPLDDPPLTFVNARAAHLTVAFALDTNSAGERLRQKAHGDRYVLISLTSDTDAAAEKLLASLRKFNVSSLNVTGNGIYSLEPKGWPQSRINVYLFTVLQRAIARWPISTVISAGEAGVQLAGVTAAHALGIDATARLPHGFRQRGLDNKNRAHTASEIRQQIVAGAAPLQAFSRVVKNVAEVLPDREARAQEPQANAVCTRSTASVEPRKPRVFNIKRDLVPQDAIYIGRGTWRGQKSKLGNPFAIGANGDRHSVCDRFEEWAPTQPEIMAEIEKLRDKDLACYCAPNRCHGNWILKVANRELMPSEAPSPSTVALHIQFDPQI